MPAVLNIISNRYENLKNNPNNVKPSRGVILCVIVTRKNIKLQKLQTSQKTLHKMSYHVRCFMAFFFTRKDCEAKAPQQIYYKLKNESLYSNKYKGKGSKAKS
jgi:hypothetical protein